MAHARALSPASPFAAQLSTLVEPHTLILGSQPTAASLKEGRYYASPTSAFWWLAGDAMGFRYDAGEGSNGEPLGRDEYFQALRYQAPKQPYSEALDSLTRRGFALWDVLSPDDDQVGRKRREKTCGEKERGEHVDRGLTAPAP